MRNFKQTGEEGRKITNNLRVGINFSLYATFLFLFLFSISFSSALPQDLQTSLDFQYEDPINYSLIPTVNSSDYAHKWITSEGILDDVSDILHSWLSSTSLLWSNAGHVMDTFLDMNSNDITEINSLNFENVKIKELTPNSQIDGSVLGVMMTNPPNQELPHFILQSGGDSQASVIIRSLMIQNEINNFTNTTDVTSCISYMDEIGEELKIDCNTTTTGADLLISDDLQVVDEVWLKDTDGEWHFMTRELQLLDADRLNTMITGINVSITDGNNFTLTEKDGNTLVVNLHGNTEILDKTTDSILLTEGTNTTPIFNHVYYQDGGSTILSKSTSQQPNVADVGMALLGDGYDYGSIGGSSSKYEFTRKNYFDSWFRGEVYQSGLDINVSSTEINISEGYIWLLMESKPIEDMHSTSEMAIEIHSDGTFHQHINDLNGYDTYSTGETIANNKYFNFVCGIANVESNGGRIYCQVQDKPSTEHTKLIDAETDTQYINYFPTNDFIKKLYTPVVQVVMQRTGGINTIQTLTTYSGNFIDLRGRNLGTGGSPPTPGITSLSQLNIDTNLEMGIYNTTANYLFGNATFLDGLPETDITGLVPYIGANQDVNIGENTFTVGNPSYLGYGTTSSIINNEFDDGLNNWTDSGSDWSVITGTDNYAMTLGTGTSILTSDTFTPVVGKMYRIKYKVVLTGLPFFHMTVGGYTASFGSYFPGTWDVEDNFVATSTDIPTMWSTGFSGECQVYNLEITEIYETDIPILNAHISKFKTLQNENSVGTVGLYALPLGFNSQASGNYATALSNDAVASGQGGIAMSISSDATGLHSVAGGYNAQATNTATHAFGYNFVNPYDYSFGIGFSTLDFLFTKTDFKILQDNHKFIMGVGGDTEIYFDGTNTIYDNVNGGLHYFDGGNISVTGINYHTEVDTSPNALEWFKDGKNLLNEDGTPNHVAFEECYVNETHTDFSRPEYNITYQEILNLTTLENDIVILNETYYPYKTYKDAISGECMYAKQNQALANLNDVQTIVNTTQYGNVIDFDNGIMTENLWTQSKVINLVTNYALKFLNVTNLDSKDTHKNKEILILPNATTDVLNMEDRIVDLEGAFSDHMTCMYLNPKYDDYRACMLDLNPKDKIK